VESFLSVLQNRPERLQSLALKRKRHRTSVAKKS